MHASSRTCMSMQRVSPPFPSRARPCRLAGEAAARYSQGPAALRQLLLHGESDAWLALGLMFQLSVLPLSKQLTNLSGSIWNKTLQVGLSVGVLVLTRSSQHDTVPLGGGVDEARRGVNMSSQPLLDNGGALICSSSRRRSLSCSPLPSRFGVAPPACAHAP